MIGTDQELSDGIKMLGETVTIAGATVYGILERPFVSIEGIESNRPILTVLTSAMVGVSRTAAVVAGGQNYTIRSIQPDGAGLTVLELETA